MKKNLYEIKGTIAYELNQHMDELAKITNARELKLKIINILQTADIKKEQDRQKCISILCSCSSLSQLLSTIATYLTGVKVG